MKQSVSQLVAGLWLGVALLFSSPVYAQYGGGMGGMGGGRMGGMGSQGMSNSGGQRQMGPSAADIASRQTDWMKTNLSLTKEQVKEVKKLNNTFATRQQTEVRALITGDAPPSEATRQQIREVTMMINEEKEDQLKPILTPDQWTLYQTKRDSLSKTIGNGTGRMMGPGRSN